MAALFAVVAAGSCTANATASTVDSRIITGADDGPDSGTAGGDTGEAKPRDAGSGHSAGHDAGTTVVVDAGSGGARDAGFVSTPDAGTVGPVVDAGPEQPVGLTGVVEVGSVLRPNTSLNLRMGPGIDHSIRLVLPVGVDVVVVNVGAPTNGWYNVSYNGVEGWSSGRYLELVRRPNQEPTARDFAIERARSAVGFSYWWGHGRYIPYGATSSTIGTCVGNCPDCTHGGAYGADCSGYVAKVWQVPSTNTDPTVDSHPYGTIHFIGTNSRWSTVARTAAKRGDAFTYNIDGSGHIFIFELGDAWGDMWTFEARGCSYGIVHNLRSAGDEFKVIARTGY